MAQVNFKVYDPIFHQPIILLFGYTEDEMYAWLKKHYQVTPLDDRHPSWEAQSFYLSAEGQPITSVICFHTLFDDDLHTQSVLVHELNHTIIKLWDTDNVVVNLATQEFFCQTLGDLYETIWKKYAELRNKKRKTHGRKRNRVKSDDSLLRRRRRKSDGPSDQD